MGIFASLEVVQPLGEMNSTRALFLSERKGQRQPSPRCVCREKRKESNYISSNTAWDDLHIEQHRKGLREDEEEGPHWSNSWR